MRLPPVSLPGAGSAPCRNASERVHASKGRPCLAQTVWVAYSVHHGPRAGVQVAHQVKLDEARDVTEIGSRVAHTVSNDGSGALLHLESIHRDKHSPCSRFCGLSGDPSDLPPQLLSTRPHRHFAKRVSRSSHPAAQNERVLSSQENLPCACTRVCARRVRLLLISGAAFAQGGAGFRNAARAMRCCRRRASSMRPPTRPTISRPRANTPPASGVDAIGSVMGKSTERPTGVSLPFKRPAAAGPFRHQVDAGRLVLGDHRQRHGLSATTRRTRCCI